MLHNIKIKQCYADAVLSGKKTFEVRKNDRGYNAGDIVQFKVISDDQNLPVYDHPLNDTQYEITYIHSGLGLQPDYVVFGIKFLGKVTKITDLNFNAGEA